MGKLSHDICHITDMSYWFKGIPPETSAVCCLLFVLRMATTSLKVYLGRLTLANSSPDEVLLQVRRVVIHPLYIKRTKTNDIALLELSAPVTFTNFIRPVCLAAEGSNFNPGTQCWITGWGRRGTNGRTWPCLWRCYASRTVGLGGLLG